MLFCLCIKNKAKGIEIAFSWLVIWVWFETDDQLYAENSFDRLALVVIVTKLLREERKEVYMCINYLYTTV